MNRFTQALLVVSLTAAANVAMAQHDYYPSNDSALAGFPSVPGGTARSYADAHQNDRVLQGDAAFPEEDTGIAGSTPIPGGTARSYTGSHRNYPVLHAASSFPSNDPEIAGE